MSNTPNADRLIEQHLLESDVLHVLALLYVEWPPGRPQESGLEAIKNRLLRSGSIPTPIGAMQINDADIDWSAPCVGLIATIRTSLDTSKSVSVLKAPVHKALNKALSWKSKPLAPLDRRDGTRLRVEVVNLDGVDV